MATIDTLIFDFDGTLADTGNAITDALEKTLRDNNLPVPDRKKLRSYIGLYLRDIMAKALGSNDATLIDSMCDQYRTNFGDIAQHKIELFPGVKATLEEFHEAGYRIGIATSRSHSSLDGLIDRLGIGEYIDVAFAEEDVENKKPAPDLAMRTMAHLSTKPENTLVVGDTSYDIRMGQMAGCHTCAGTYGNQSERELEATLPDYIIDSFPTLLSILAE